MTDLGLRHSVLDRAFVPDRARRTTSPARPPELPLVVDLCLAALVVAGLAVARPAVPAGVVLALLACWAGCLGLTGATRPSCLESRGRETARVARAGCYFAFAGSALSLLPAADLTTAEAFAVAGACTALSAGFRAVLRCRRRAQARLLVVGGAAERRYAVEALTRRSGPSVEVVSACIAPDGQASPDDLAVTVDELPGFARRVGARSVVAVPGSGLDPVQLRRLRWVLEAERLPCFVSTALQGVAPGRLRTVDVDGVPLLRADTSPRSGPAWLLTGWCGRLLATVALVLLAPLLLALVAAIRLGSSGPAVFRQVRVGQGGRTFTVYKLRTMRCEPLPEDALVNDFEGVLFKMREDPRVTPLGRLLRKYSLDELPQLLNVVLGQMRLVGPRPALPDEAAAYTEDERRRLAMPPGITGLWQVSGRSDLTWEETVRLDLHYVDNWSVGLDLLILCRTVRAVLGHRGAY